MQRGFLIGELPSGEIKLIESGDPREMRRMFKQADGKGLVSLEVVESTVGRTRRKRFPKNYLGAVAKPAPEPENNELHELDGINNDEIESLVELAKGDKRRADVKDALARLAELGIDP